MSEKSKYKILIIDDIKGNIDFLSYALQNFYKIESATDGLMALQNIEKSLPDLILLDIMMPGINGFQVCKKLKANKRTKNIPVIFITGMNDIEDKAEAFNLGAVDYITKPFELLEVKARVSTHLNLKKAREELQNQNQVLEENVRERTRELHETQLEIVYRLGRASEYRDNETGMHIKRMSHFCVMLGHAYGMNKEECDLLLHASPLHDVGKIGIPDSILLKPGKLDPDEWETMKTHVVIGGEILSGHNSRQLQMAQLIALTHHEKWDGSGYPEGLKEKNIPIEGRIAGLCDVFDALISERSYKKAWPVDEAIGEIKNGSGSHFDPRLVELFTPKIDEIISIKEKFSDSTT